MYEEQLKPCPFCGGKVHVIADAGSSTRIECKQCGVHTCSNSYRRINTLLEYSVL